ncbi:hypothetical protein BGZ99_009811 [Dissophora globulifera]|uniref:Uncharacterized protein n=1 Tax=Dissophora globulifera TaxID=979702 RepID=A0A9P6RQH1_9FUNG|nr:hypothetical protein BGZ99_009811 [Dissophora globulifera]
MNSQLRCPGLARYHNFEAARPNHGLEYGETQCRVGQMHPDVVDLEQDYQNLFVKTDAATNEGEGKAVRDSRRKLVMDTIQREKSKRLINDEELIQELVQAGFRNPRSDIPPGDRLQVVFQTICGPNRHVDELAREHCPYCQHLEGALDLMGSLSLILGLPNSMIKSDEKESSMSNEVLGELQDVYRSYVKDDPRVQKLAEEELNIHMRSEQPDALIRKYGGDINAFLSNFWKGTPRCVNNDRVTKLVHSLQQDLEQEKIVEEAIQHNHSIGAAQKSYILCVGARHAYSKDVM